MTIYSNIVEKSKLREVQLGTLEAIKNALINSFGPMGSNTAIKKDNSLTQYTKDGHTILKNIIFNQPIEFATKEDLEDLTRYIVKTVGDGTTSAIVLATIIFMETIKMEEKIPPFVIIEKFKKCVARIVDEIKTHTQEVDLDAIYKIALIATNGNEEIASNIKNIYEKFGMNVFIDVNISNTTENLIKIYDGMTLETGYADSCFINNKALGVSSIRNPKIYVFEDPIDTPEMIGLFDTIIVNNILKPINQQDSNIIPTVILSPKISKDMSSYMDSITQFMCKANDAEKPPLLIITNIYDKDQFIDLARLCGAKLIKKYLDPKIQATDIVNGLAPTPETLCEFAGDCEAVESNFNKSKFINPINMKNEDGEYSELFTAMVDYLEAELKNAQDNGENAGVVGPIKRRINALKGNMVEYLVGGVSMSDRDSLRDLVEDAVLNCRSAAKDGYGYGSNFEGLRASSIICSDQIEDKLESNIMAIICKAYMNLSIELYNTYYMNIEEASNTTKTSLELGMPFNIRQESFDGNVLSSINSDIVILETISKIVTLMFTCNQFICQSPMHNVYAETK